MQRIAELTGGACLTIEQLSKLVNREPITTTVRSERPLWANGLVAFLHAFGRVFVMLVLLVVSTYQARLHGWRHLRRFDPAKSALKIENHKSGLDSLLVTAGQFSNSGASPGTAQSL